MKEPEPIIFVTVDAGSDEAAYEQIARQIRTSISSGALPPGTALPSVRTLASDLGYNLNTVARAYRLLQEDGFVRIRDRAGAEVIGPARSPSAGVRDRLGRELGQVIVRLRQAGVRPDEIRTMVQHELAALAGREVEEG
ncbi:MAG: GntR family transcriptional regulator [Acidobacteriota bacterium]|jgi:DNA-binding transcriptional regulator YhcF (GntR family)